jgi:hypothetical protein
VAHLGDLPVKTIAARPCFIAKTQPTTPNGQLLHQPADVIWAVQNCPPMADLSATLPLRDRGRNRCLVDIQPDERASLHLVSPTFLRLGARQPGATLERRMPRERPLTQSAHTAIMGFSRPLK